MTLRVGTAGAGRWGRNLVRVFASLPGATLAGACDERESVRKTLQATYRGATVVDSASRLIETVELDALVVATPPLTHYAIARQALEAGLHIFVEKPLTLSAREAWELVRLAREKKRIVMVGHLLLYHPAIQWIMRRVKEGDLGDVYYLYSQRVNLGQVRADENALWSLAPHDISLMMTMLGVEPSEASASGGCYLQPGVEDVVFLSLKFPDGKLGHVHLSWLDPHRMRRVTIVGSKKMMVFDDVEAAEKVRVYDKGVSRQLDYETYTEVLALRSGDIQIPAIAPDEPLKAECAEFVRCATEGREPLSSGEHGARVVEVLEAASASLKEGGRAVQVRTTS